MGHWSGGASSFVADFAWPKWWCASAAHWQGPPEANAAAATPQCAEREEGEGMAMLHLQSDKLDEPIELSQLQECPAGSGAQSPSFDGKASRARGARQRPRKACWGRLYGSRWPHEPCGAGVGESYSQPDEGGYSQMEQMLLKLRESKCREAADALESRLTHLRSYFRSRQPDGQKIDSLGAMLHKQSKQTELLEEQLQEQPSKMETLRKKLADSKMEEERIQKELDEVRQSLVADTAVDGSQAEPRAPVNAAAAVVSAYADLCKSLSLPTSPESEKVLATCKQAMHQLVVRLHPPPAPDLQQNMASVQQAALPAVVGKGMEEPTQPASAQELAEAQQQYGACPKGGVTNSGPYAKAAAHAPTGPAVH